MLLTRILRYCLGFCLALSVGMNVGFANEALTRTLSEIVEQALPQASAGFMLTDADTGEVVSEYRAQKLFTPASNIKLFLGAAALYRLGADYRYQTAVYAPVNTTAAGVNTRGDLIIRFSGDPSLTHEDINALIGQLKQRPMYRIRGNIIIDDSEFSEPDWPAGISFNDLPWYYAAPVNSIIIDKNQVKVLVKAGGSINSPATLTPYPSDKWLTYDAKVTTVDDEVARKRCSFSVAMTPRNHLIAKGCWPMGRKQAEKGIAIANPYARAEQLIRQALAAHHITFHGRVLRGHLPPNAVLLAKHQSQPLSQLVAYLMKESDNTYANAILKTLGKSVYSQGTFKQGVLAMKSVLARHTSVDLTSILLADGSGTRYNKLSPFATVSLLQTIYNAPAMKKTFMQTLPIAQVDGTLKERFREVNLPGRLIAKTGTMHDTSSISGYLISRSGKTYIFSIMINHVTGGVMRAKQVEEKIALKMLDSLN